jgi:hypothetical protein
MPKAEPQWKFATEADEMVKKIIQTYPERFSHIDPDQLGCAMIEGKDPPDSQDWDCKINGITAPEQLFSKKTYVLHFFRSTWEKYDKRQRAAMLFRQIVRIPEEFDGKLAKEDLKDCRCLVKAFGLGYMNSPKLPDLLDAKQPLGGDGGEHE